MVLGESDGGGSGLEILGGRKRRRKRRGAGGKISLSPRASWLSLIGNANDISGAASGDWIAARPSGAVVRAFAGSAYKFWLHCC